jgi:hypothetical protein
MKPTKHCEKEREGKYNGGVSLLKVHCTHVESHHDERNSLVELVYAISKYNEVVGFLNFGFFRYFGLNSGPTP